MSFKVKIVRTNGAKVPYYAHKGDAGVDLYSAEEYTLSPMEIKVIGTGIKAEIPYGYEAQIRPKSGLASQYGITQINSPGTIDSSYRGEIKIPLINLSSKAYKIEKGAKIAQMVFSKVEEAVFEEVNELGSTTRGDGGFGSTGLK